MSENIFINIPTSGSKSWKDPVDTFADLPLTNNNVGDARITKDTLDIYGWNGSTWVLLSGPSAFGIDSLNGLTASSQTFTTGEDGSDFNIASAGSNHQFNLPIADATHTGKLTSSAFTIFNNKQPAGNYITDLTGDVLASGPGSVSATVAFVSGLSASLVASGATLANNSTDANTASTIVRRDPFGNFSASTIYADLVGNVTGTASGNAFPIENQLIVQTNPGTGEFSSIATALASITTNSSSNPFLIYVGPGVYTEPQLVMKPFVWIRGAAHDETVIEANSTSINLIVGSDNSGISDCLLQGSTDAGKTAIFYQSTTGTSRDSFCVQNVRFGNNDTQAIADGSIASTAIFFENCYFGGNHQFNHGFLGQAGGRIVMRNSTTTSLSSPFPDYVFKATGSGSQIVLNSIQCRTGSLTSGNAIHIANGGEIRASSINIKMFDTAVFLENTGSASKITIQAILIEDCTNHFVIDDPGATGSIQGIADESASSFALGTVGNITILLADPIDGDIDASGALKLQQADGIFTDVTTLITESSTMGVMEGGLLSDGGGLDVDVSFGFGYYEIEPEILKRLDWTSMSLTLPANQSNYIYFDPTGTLTFNQVAPDSKFNILLGRVATVAASIDFIDSSPLDAEHTSNRFDLAFRDGFGPIYAFGSIVTESGTRNLDVSAGRYYLSMDQFNPSGGSTIAYHAYYQDGSGGSTRISQSTVDNAFYDDGSGTLAAIPSTEYAKHSFYVVNDGANEKYMLVYAQATYATLVEVEAADLPLPPTSFIEGVSLIASLIVQQGSSTIVEIRDERPIIGFKAGGISAAAYHGNLLGLLADDHPQYLRTDGTRTLTGNQSFGGFDITNVHSFSASVASIIGNANEVQLTLKGNSTQTTDIFQVRQSDNTLVAQINNSGSFTTLGTILASNFSGSSSGTNTGDQTITLTGDITGSGTGSFVTTLATVNGNVGSFGSSTSIPSFTVNAKGLITAASGNVVIAPAGTLTGTTLAANVVSSSLTSVGTITSGTWNSTTIAIANGGTGQTTANTAFNALSPLTTKGDLVGYSTVNARVPIGTDGQVLTADSTQTLGLKWATPTTGTVTSVALADGSSIPIFTITGSPVTSSGTLTFSLQNQSANRIFSGPSTGSPAQPTFRALVSDDIPNLDTSKITTGIFSIARGGTNSGTALNNNRIMISSASAIVESAAITANRALKSDSNGIPVASTATSTSLDALSGTNTGDQTITLTGDVTGTGTGSFATTIATGAVTDTKASLLDKPSIGVVATTNQTLSGFPTIDSVTVVDGTLILLSAQTTGSENGPWVAHSGAWTRPTWYPSGGTTQALQFMTTFVRLGTVYQGSTWRQTAAGPFTIDTTSTTWTVTPLAISSSTVTGTLSVSNGGTSLSTLTANNVILGNGTSAPTFVAPGTSGNVLTSNGTTWTSAAASTGATANIQVFTGSGTWTKPSGAKWVDVIVVGAGGGGGSGQFAASGANASGGCGGGGGVQVRKFLNASDLGASVTVTVGAGGTAGAAVTTTSAAGNAGGIGGDSSFGTILTGYAGGGGSGGTGSRSGGSGGGTAGDGATGAGAAVNGGFPNAGTGVGIAGGGAGVSVTNDIGQPAENGGGAGGGSTGGAVAGKTGGTSVTSGGGGGAGGSTNTTTGDGAGGAGGASMSYNANGGGGGAGGAAGAGGAPGAGTAGASNLYGGNGGGGGGASALSGNAGGVGGAGGSYGGGGGGGGGGRNLAGVGSSGAGGAGGPGVVIVATFF